MSSTIIVYLIFTVYFIYQVSSAPGTTDDMAILEYGPGYNTYGHQQMKMARSRGIKPIVDTIREEEKYGNDGGQIRTASQAIIKLTEGVSASISNTLGTPNENTYNILKPFDPILVDLGNRLGGIA